MRLAGTCVEVDERTIDRGTGGIAILTRPAAADLGMDEHDPRSGLVYDLRFRACEKQTVWEDAVA